MVTFVNVTFVNATDISRSLSKCYMRHAKNHCAKVCAFFCSFTTPLVRVYFEVRPPALGFVACS